MEEGGSHPSAETAGLEESVRQLSLNGEESDRPAYPERPGEPGCNYYMRTGRCDFGVKCRFNHPRNRMIPESAIPGAEYPERAGQPVCQYFLKTGSCKFGSTCKYHHPMRNGDVAAVQLNIYGYPIRKGERECSYYVKNGSCKFGATCKFHHPQPSIASTHEPAHPFYLSTMPGGVGSGAYVAGPYGPMFIPSEMIPVPGWSPYMPLGIHLAEEEGSMNTQPHHQAPIFPERPDEPECQHYVKTGRCKFGSSCKFHHPPEKIGTKASYFLNPVGLPLRPGAPYCIFFAQHGVCKFGPSCKFDHPMGTLPYSPSASSHIDMALPPFPLQPSAMSSVSPSSFSALSLSTAQAPTQIPTSSSTTAVIETR